VSRLSSEFEIVILALGYRGDPHPFPFRIFPAFVGGDAHGVNRIAEIVLAEHPDLILIQNDPWNIPPYLEALGGCPAPILGAVAVDGLNCQGSALSGLDHAIFWTEFAAAEAKRGGYTGAASVIPLGVDRSIYRPMPKREAWQTFGNAVAEKLEARDAFIVGNVNRNQPRKRLDLTISYFAKWIQTHDAPRAMLFLHVCPTGETGCDVRQLVKYYGLTGRVILAEPNIGIGESEERVRETYCCFDVLLTTTQGEGFGLPTLEAMACGIPAIVPYWSALGEWAAPYALAVPCDMTSITPNGINVLGGVADRDMTIANLDYLYSSEEGREAFRQKALICAEKPEFQWRNIANRYSEVLRTILEGRMLNSKCAESTVA
jgi:glycosyltransferase involved in cell wall biosynthesis